MTRRSDSKKPKKRAPVKESALRRLRIPARFVGMEMQDIPGTVPYRKALFKLRNQLADCINNGMLIWLAGPRHSGRDVAAFMLAKEFRRARQHGRCIEGVRIGKELGSFFDDAEMDLQRLQFLVLYDVVPKMLKDFEIRLLLSVIVRFLNDCKSVILTSSDVASWNKHPVLGQIKPLIEEDWGIVIPCSGRWLPKGLGGSSKPTTPGDLKWG